MGHLDSDELVDVRDAAFQAGFADPATRVMLFQGVMPEYVGALPQIANPIPQLHSDLAKMNEVGRLVDGRVPLEVWLRNAARDALATEQRSVLERAHDKVASQFSGEPEVPDEDLSDIPEEIVHEDDTVAYSFLRMGWEAGAAVARLRVPPFAGGVRRKMNNVEAPAHIGTGWLVTPSLLMTNYHVVAARDGAEVDAVSEQDLRLQGQDAVAEFGYDSETAEKSAVPCKALEAWDRALDYAVLRLEGPSDRRPLSVAADQVELGPDGRLPVNIIQHPDGDSKRVGLRNNLVDKVVGNDLRYFTDTRKGSSGSPVLDDHWRVVALHRASRRIPTKNFQGRETAVANVGSQMHAVLAHLATASPDVYAEIERDGLISRGALDGSE